MQSLKEVQKNEEEKPLHYLYVQGRELYCTNCDFIGYYLLHKECWICDATWPQGKEPKEEERKDINDLESRVPVPLVIPAPLVMQLSVPHMPDTPEYKKYNRELDYILEERTRLSSVENKKISMVHK